MAHLLHPNEPVAAATVPGLAAELAGFAPSGSNAREALAWAGTLTILDPAPTTRVRLLGDLLFPDETPNALAVEHEMMSRWLGPSSAVDLLRAIEPDPACPVLIDSTMWSAGAIAADWAFFLDRFADRQLLGWHTVVTPWDARWVLSTGIEEHVRVVRPSFARIRALTFAPRTEIAPGRTVPRALCRVTFDDGTAWDSDQIRGSDPRRVARAFLRFLSARTGVRPIEVDVLTRSVKDAPRSARSL